MGCLFSRVAARRAPHEFDGVRVFHMNGDWEDFDAPVTSAEILGRHPKHVLCSKRHLAAFGTNPIRRNDPLEPGLHFLIPQRVYQDLSSPADLAALMKRVTAAAASTGRRLQPMRSVSAPPASATRKWRPEFDRIVESPELDQIE